MISRVTQSGNLDLQLFGGNLCDIFADRLVTVKSAGNFCSTSSVTRRESISHGTSRDPIRTEFTERNGAQLSTPVFVMAARHRHDLSDTHFDDYIAPFSDSIQRALSGRSAGWVGVCELWRSGGGAVDTVAPSPARAHSRAAPRLRSEHDVVGGSPPAGRRQFIVPLGAALFRGPGQSTRGVSQAELVAPRGRRMHALPAGIRHGPAPRAYTCAHVCVCTSIWRVLAGIQ